MKAVHKQQQNLLIILERTLKRVKEHVSSTFQSNGIEVTFDQWVILMHIAENQGISQIKLCQLTSKQPASLTRILNKLLERQLIFKRSNNDNRRANKLYLSPKGMDLESKVTPIYEGELKAIFSKTYERELNLIQEVLNRVS